MGFRQGRSDDQDDQGKAPTGQQSGLAIAKLVTLAILIGVEDRYYVHIKSLGVFPAPTSVALWSGFDFVMGEYLTGLLVLRRVSALD